MYLRILNEDYVNTLPPVIDNNRFFRNGKWDWEMINKFITENPDISKYTLEEKEAYQKYITRYPYLGVVTPNSFKDKHPYAYDILKKGAALGAGAAIGLGGVELARAIHGRSLNYPMDK